MAGWTNEAHSSSVAGTRSLSPCSRAMTLANRDATAVSLSASMARVRMSMPAIRFSGSYPPASRAPTACLQTWSAWKINWRNWRNWRLIRPGGRLLFMNYRVFLVILAIALPVQAQISRDAKYDILRTVLADTASARMALP